MCAEVEYKRLRMKEALQLQVCLVLLYSCAVGVKSTAASLRALSLRVSKQDDETRHETEQTHDEEKLLNKLPGGEELHPSGHALIHCDGAVRR